MLFLAVFGFRSGPDGSGQAVGFIWFLFWAKRSILDPFLIKFDVFGPHRNFGQPGLDLGFLLLRQDRCLLETGQMTAAAETSLLSQQK